MRMRKLGVGQSVVFCVPEEIETKVRAMTANDSGQSMSVQDVLEWAIQGTWADLHRSMPLWLAQGKTFATTKALWDLFRSENGKSLIEGGRGKDFLEDESLSLEARYHPRDNPSRCTLESTDRPVDKSILDQILQRCDLYGGVEVDSTRLHEEQERELAPEVEQERQLERPAPAKPAKHFVHPAVWNFVSTGKINEGTRSSAFIRAFEMFKRTSASTYLDLDHFPGSLLVTRDFERTVTATEMAGVCIDNYIRGVQWVLSNGRKRGTPTTFVIVSPYEANKLIPNIETSRFVTLHLFSPRTNQAFRPLDDLSLYTIPSGSSLTVPMQLRVELMLFSGQLYFESYEQYVEVCNFLCLAHTTTFDKQRVVVQPDGFIDPASQPSNRDVATILEQSPIPFLKCLLARGLRPGRGIERTDLGRILQGALLSKGSFE